MQELYKIYAYRARQRERYIKKSTKVTAGQKDWSVLEYWRVLLCRVLRYLWRMLWMQAQFYTANIQYIHFHAKQKQKQKRKRKRKQQTRTGNAYLVQCTSHKYIHTFMVSYGLLDRYTIYIILHGTRILRMPRTNHTC